MAYKAPDGVTARRIMRSEAILAPLKKGVFNFKNSETLVAVLSEGIKIGIKV